MDAHPYTIYHPLDASRKEIRLLDITGEVDGRLICVPSTISLTANPPPFRALSYVWGDPTLTEIILLNGVELKVTPNLNTALRSAKTHWQTEFPDRDPATFRLWVDGICINQNDNEERASQVQLMAALYASAELVIGWLGTAEQPHIAKALKCIAAIGPWFNAMQAMRPAGEWGGQIAEGDLAWLSFLFPHLCDLDPDTEHPGPGPGNSTWSAVCFLLELPYWHRLWIFQEAVLANRLLLACPLAATPYSMLEHIADAVRQIDRWWSGHAPSFIHRRIWRTIFRSPPRWEKAYIIQHARNRRLAFADNVSQPSGLPDNVRTTVYDLAYAAAKLQATNLKDYVYGMLGVTGLSISPDYGDDTPHYAPWMDWVKTWTKLPVPSVPDPQFSELKFLCMAGIGFFDYPSGCPSWVPHFSGIAAKPPGTPPWLLGMADEGLGPDAALLDLNDSCLKVWGLAVQLITRVVQLPLPDRSNPERALALNCSGITTALLHFIAQFISQNRLYIAGGPPLLALTRVFLCDFATPLSDVLFFKGYRMMLAILISAWAKSQPTCPTDFISLDTFLAEQLCEETSTFNTIKWLLSNLWTDLEIQKSKFEPRLEWFRLSWDDSDHLLDSLGEIGYLVQGLVPFETENGHVGMCPRGSLAGDFVCVLHGSKVPIILRPVEGSSTQYRHVGLCSLLGFMNGEASSSNLREFEII